MTYLLIAGVILMASAVLSLSLRRNDACAAVALVGQLLATSFALAAVVPVVALGAGALHAEWPWSFPVERVTVRVDALSAFFLAWSLPMTLLGSVYAVGYLRPYFDTGRHGAPHFALLNMVSLSFIIIY